MRKRPNISIYVDDQRALLAEAKIDVPFPHGARGASEGDIEESDKKLSEAGEKQLTYQL